MLSQIIYFCETLYMFRKVFSSIIKSSRLHDVYCSSFFYVYLTVVNNSATVWSTHNMDALHRDGDKFPIVSQMYVISNSMLSQIIYFCEIPYMFRKVFSSIIKSSRLHDFYCNSFFSYRLSYRRK